MALGTFDELKIGIANHLDRDDLSAHIVDFISLAEARHKREVRIREMLSRDALSIDDRYVDLPDGYLEAKTLRILTSPVTVLTYVNLHEMNRLRGTTGKPQYFTVHGQIEFDKEADETYDGEIVFYEALTALSDSNPTNDLLTRAPDLYLYGSLLASAPFLLNDDRLEVWGGLYQDARDAVNDLDRRASRIGPIITRTSGATP